MSIDTTAGQILAAEALIRRGMDADDALKLVGLGCYSGDECHLVNDDGAVLIIENGWYADHMGTVEIHYPDADSAQEAAQEYVDSGGDWGDPDDSTEWIYIDAWRSAREVDEDGDLLETMLYEQTVSVEVDPEEPACVDGHDHDWQSPYEVLGGCAENPGVWGHGGGVIIREVCRHCGRYRVTDTWSQDMSTGEQGLTSVSYEDADETSIAWLASD